MSDKVVKIKLKVQLLANDVLVAESLDEQLWHRILGAMQGRGEIDQLDINQDITSGDELSSAKQLTKSKQKDVSDFAATLELKPGIVQGACDPSVTAPFIHLDEHYWESLKKNIPRTGKNAVPAITLAATLLCLWIKYSGIEVNITPALARSVLKNIGEKEGNPTRAIKNCEWLQSRSGIIQINAAKISKAKAIVRAYCLQEPVKD